MSQRNGDYRVALLAGFLFMLILSWFPPFGIIIAGFLTGFISEKAKEGAIMGAILAALGALIQLTFVSRVIPLLGLSISVIGLLNTFGPLSGVFLAVGDFLLGTNFAGSLALFSLYSILGALGGFFGGLVR